MTKAKVVTQIRPMLASRGTWEDKDHEDSEWVAEEKFDGSRYLAFYTKSGVRIVSRRGVEKTDRLPKLVADLESIREGIPAGTILDGEVVAGTFSETISLVNSLGSRGVDASTPYRYMLFDILKVGKDWVVEQPFTARRTMLAGVCQLLSASRAEVPQLTPSIPGGRFASSLEKIWSAGGEGLIVKKVSARYEQGKRSRSWIKVKSVLDADGVILGFTAGEGKYSNTVGAIVVGQYKNGKLTPITKISGMTDEVRYTLGGSPKSFIGQVVEFAYQNRTDESYRHPRFKRFRADKAPEDCTWEGS